MRKKRHGVGGASWGRPVARGAAAFWWLMLAMMAPAVAESCFERLESAQKPTWQTIQQSFRKRGVTIAFPTRQDCEDPARCQMTVGTNETGPLFSVDLSRDKDGVECELKAGRSRVPNPFKPRCRGYYNYYLIFSVKYKTEWDLFLGSQNNSEKNQDISKCIDVVVLDVPTVVKQGSSIDKNRYRYFDYSFVDKLRLNRPTPFRFYGS